MAGRRRAKRRPPVKCPDCGSRANWHPGDRDVRPYFECGEWDGEAREYAGGCGRIIREEDAPPPDDGRISGPEDALARLAGALEAAARDGRLSELDRQVHAVYCERATELGWLEVMAGDAWVCERLGLDPAAGHRTRVTRSRRRLAALGYVKEMKEGDVRHRGLKAQVAARKREGKRPVSLLEVQKAPAYPTCDYCGGEIPDVQRVSARYCSPRCRKASGRVPPELEAALAAALGSSR